MFSTLPESAKEEPMTRFVSLIFCAALGAGFLACGSSTPSDGAGGAGGGGAGGGGTGTGGSASPKVFLDLFPRAGDVSGWSIDPGSAKTKDVVAATGTDQAAVEALIDGASADFFKSPATPVVFGVQAYVNTTVSDAPADGSGVKVKLYILQMPNAGQASALYASLLDANLYSPWNQASQQGAGKWADPSSTLVGDHSRIVNAGDTWWINFYKGVYYGEVWLTPSYGPAPAYVENDAILKDAAFAFATAVAAKM
jgi:hypothetical protein